MQSAHMHASWSRLANSHRQHATKQSWHAAEALQHATSLCLIQEPLCLSGHMKHIKSKSTAVHQFNTDVAAPALL